MIIFTVFSLQNDNEKLQNIKQLHSTEEGYCKNGLILGHLNHNTTFFVWHSD